MTLRKLGAMVLAAVLAAGLLPAGALAARNEKMDADQMDIPAIIEAKDAEGTVNVYHWWTAGGEKDAIESVVDGFSNTYPNIRAKSNAIPGGAGGAMVMKVKVLQDVYKRQIFICSGLHDPVAIETTYPTMQLFSELDIPFTKRMYPGNHMWHPWRQGLYHFLTNLLW